MLTRVVVPLLVVGGVCLWAGLFWIDDATRCGLFEVAGNTERMQYECRTDGGERMFGIIFAAVGALGVLGGFITGWVAWARSSVTAAV